MRPYIPIQAGLMCEMEGRASYSNACRDARLVRPLAFQLKLISKRVNKLIVIQHIGTHKPYICDFIHMERTHEPCVPTYLYRPD